MPNYALLNNVQHKQLRVITDRGPEYGDAVRYALTFPDEFRSLQSTYPIVFSPNAEGGLDAVALFGFESGENLFLGPDGWDASVIPLSVERLPFLIGNTPDGPQVLVDLEHPRVSARHGEPVFQSYGGTTEYMERITSVLRTVHEGVEDARRFFDALRELDLIESFVADVELDDGSEHRMTGFYTINEDRLAALTGEQLEALNRAGYLQPAFMAIASLAQLRGLIERRNRKQADR